MADTLDGMSVAGLEELRQRVEATLQQKKAQDPWALPEGVPTQIDGVWYAMAEYVLHRVNGNRVEFSVPGGDWVLMARRWLNGPHAGIPAERCRTILALIFDANPHMPIDR